MNKQIFVINGSGSVGKDTFINYVNQIFNYYVMNYSSVYRVKKIARDCGWGGFKSEKDRKFLSDLKSLLVKYNDLPFRDMRNVANTFNCEKNRNCKLLFLHIREPEEIKRAVEEFGAKTILVKRDAEKHIESNMSDKNVFDFDYDVVVENNGTLEDLAKKAYNFVNDIKNNSLKEKY